VGPGGALSAVDVPLVNLAPMVRLGLLAAVVALLPLSWIWLRRRGADRSERLAALTALTLFLTFDLIVVGAFTRLSDSGLGCPDWPGCYGAASPLGAHAEIHAAQASLPSGPVTWTKAWIEMVHRYLAMTVGALIMVMAIVAVVERRRLPHSPAWALATLLWVIVQGLFGKYTVTLKLYPAVVTLHLLGGLVLLALLVVQHRSFRDRAPLLSRAQWRAGVAVLALLAVQITLGGWVSTNYAVLACGGFPACNGRWWPAMDWGQGFTVLRALGHTGDGALLPFEALVAVHMAHRLFAVVALAASATFAWSLWRSGPARRRAAVTLAALLVAQAGTGLSNVVLGWPLAAALLHTAGAAALVALLTALIAGGPAAATVPGPAVRWAPAA
jgi:cytochrome c oxidase assembly protein subunit 15